MNTCDRRSLKGSVQANRRKSVQQPTGMLNEGPNKISARTMRRELKEIPGSRSCVSSRKPGCDKLFGRIVYIYHLKTMEQFLDKIKRITERDLSTSL